MRIGDIFDKHESFTVMHGNCRHRFCRVTAYAVEDWWKYNADTGRCVQMSAALVSGVFLRSNLSVNRWDCRTAKGIAVWGAVASVLVDENIYGVRDGCNVFRGLVCRGVAGDGAPVLCLFNGDELQLVGPEMFEWAWRQSDGTSRLHKELMGKLEQGQC